MCKKMIKESHVLRNYAEGRLSRKEAAEALGLSERQITRKAQKLKEQGEASLIHGNKGRKPANSLSREAKDEIVGLKHEQVYEGANISHFREILGERHGKEISYGALYSLLKEAGVGSPKKHHKPSKIHQRRKRKAHEGGLTQIDATPYEWFGGDKKYALHGGIDDATGKITGLYMTENECLAGYLEMARQTCLGFGVPLAMHSDRHTIFRSPKTGKLAADGEDAPPAQFGRALGELGVAIIHARPPQAKGRVERLWGTLQSRLPVELAIRGIATVEGANEFLAQEYIGMRNAKFSIPAAEKPLYVPCRSESGLDQILCVKETRKADRAGAFSYKGQHFKILDAGYPLIPARTEATVAVSTRLGVCVHHNGRIFQTQAIEKPQCASPAPKPKLDRAAAAAAGLRHGSDEWKKCWHFESYEDTIIFLYEVFFKPSSLA